MQQDTAVGRREYEAHCQMCDERFARDKARLEKGEKRLEGHDERMEEVRRLSVQMGEMIKRHDDQLESHEKRITTLERQPAEAYGRIITGITTAVISVIVGYALGQLFQIPI